MIMSIKIFDSPRNYWLWAVAAAAIAGFLICVTWVNFNFARTNPGGSDFLTRWVATRAFLLEGISPYSNEVVHRIQLMAYGRPARPGEDEMRMAYPLYAVVVFAPYALISDYTLARAIWMTTLEVSIGLLALLSVQLVNWKPSQFNTLLLILFTILGYHSVRPLINGNVVIILALLMITTFWAMQRGLDALAGGLLAWTTIKPQLAILLIAGVFIWSISHQRWGLIRWTAGWIIGLTVIGMLIIPDWLAQNIVEVIRYPTYTSAGTVQAAIHQLWPYTGILPGRILTLILGAWLLWEWWAMWGKPFEKFLAAICLTLVISQWIGIQTDPGNFIILFLPLMLVFARAQTRWKRSAPMGITVTISILLVGLWALFLLTLIQGEQPMQSPVLFFPLPAMVLIGLLLTGNIHPSNEKIQNQ